MWKLTKIAIYPQKILIYSHYLNANIPDMKNRGIIHARNEVKIYENHYKPSLNPLRFVKSILGIVLFGSTSVAGNYVPIKKRIR